MSDTERMPMRQGVNLATALCQAVADEVGVPVLFLKGPAASLQGLRPAGHVSGDVDVMCRPADQGAMAAGLRSRGWRLRPVSTAAREFTTHSITFIHDQWPCDIDLHTTFPGMLAEPTTNFDALWKHREEHVLAGTAVQTPDRSGQFLILLLHGLRSPDLARNVQQISAARATYTGQLTPHERSMVRQLIADTASAEPTQDFFRELGERVDVPTRPSAEYALWKLKTGPSRTESWLVHALRARGSERFRILFRAAVPSREDMHADHPESVGSVWRLIRAHGQRLHRAARLTPHALRQVARARRALDAPESAGAQAVDPLTGPSSPLPQPTRADRPGRADARSTEDATTAAIARHAAEWADDHETLFVLPLASGTSRVLALKGTAAVLWTLIQESGTSVDELADAAAARWEMSPGELRDDVEVFLAQLVDCGALLAA